MQKKKEKKKDEKIFFKKKKKHTNLCIQTTQNFEFVENWKF